MQPLAGRRNSIDKSGRGQLPLSASQINQSGFCRNGRCNCPRGTALRASVTSKGVFGLGALELSEDGDNPQALQCPLLDALILIAQRKADRV